jgi:cell division protein FtsW (lipid II flippase)
VVINFKEMEYGFIRLVGLLLFAALDIGNAVIERYSMKNNRTSYAAHLSGTIAGFLVGVLVLRNLRVRRWEVIFGWFAAVFYVLLVGAAVLFNVINEDYFQPRDSSSLYDSMRKDMEHVFP